MDGRPVRVLSIDGGGIRGIIPAIVIDELERRTRLPASRLFDFMAGTSTGGMIVLGLAMPDDRGEPVARAGRLIELYEAAGQDIFVRSWHQTVHELLHERYPSETIDRTLERYFGDTRLSAAATEVLVTSYDLVSRDVFLMGSRVARDQPELDLPMRVAARATSAAPTYFEPVAVTTGVPPQPRLLIDGGVCANNPAMCAFVEVQRAQPGADVLMLSLGTGLGTRPYDVRQVPEWGLAHWARVILHVVIDGASEMVHVQLREMLDDRRYHRLQVELGDASETLDDATEANIARLRAEAERLVARSDRELDELCAELTR